MKEKRALGFFAGVSAALIIVATIILRTYYRTVEQQIDMRAATGGRGMTNEQPEDDE